MHKIHNVNNNLLREVCSITPDDDNLIMTGGGWDPELVSLYNSQGFVQYLTSLNNGRAHHACGYYRNNDGETVRNNVWLHITLIL